MTKTLSKVEIEGTHLNIQKAIYDKPTANIILNGQKLQAFPLRSGTRQACPLSPLLFNVVLEVLPRYSNQTRGRNKRHPNWKGRNKTVLFADDMVLYIEDPKDSTKKLPELIRSINSVK